MQITPDLGRIRCVRGHSHAFKRTRGFSLFDDGEEVPLCVLILRPLKDKVAGSAVTEPEGDSDAHTLQTEPTDRAVARRGRLMRVRRECGLRFGQS